MSDVELLQVDSNRPGAYCKQCGSVDATGGWRECRHDFERVIVICDYSGIWQRKQIEGLFDERVSLVVAHLPNADWRDTVDLHYFENESHLETILRTIDSKADSHLIITHNYGNRTPIRVLSHFENAIVVVHDIHTIGIKSEPIEHEVRLLELANFLVFPSERMLEDMRPYVKSTAKTLVQHQMVPERYFTWAKKSEFDAIYQGRVKDSWAAVFKRVNAAGMQVLVMPSIINNGRSYAEFGGIVPSKNYRKIIDQCSKSRWGFVGSPSIDRSMSRSMSNKFYDYIAAGAVPVVFNHSSVAHIVNKREIGIVASSVDHAIDAMKSDRLWKEYREQIYEVRKHMTMESQRPDWEAFCSLLP